MIYEDISTGDSLAHSLARLVRDTPMPMTRQLEFYAIVAQVRRAEISLDEMFREALEGETIVASAPNVVRVDFARRS